MKFLSTFLRGKGAIRVKRILVLVVAAISVVGCIDMEGTQRAMNRVDSAWGVDNRNLLRAAGTRTYKLPKADAFRAMAITLSELGFIVKNQDFTTGILLASAPIPTPLSIDEWEQIKKVEEPRMQRIAAQDAGEFTASLFRLSDNDFDTIVNVFLLERAADLQITMNFQMQYTGRKSVLTYGHQPPPEAVKYGIRKAWDHFERVALVQAKTFK